MSARNRGAFDAWFVAQYGKRPMTDAQERAAFMEKTRGESAAASLRHCSRYDACKRAASGAWQAREKQGGKA